MRKYTLLFLLASLVTAQVFAASVQIKKYVTLRDYSSGEVKGVAIGDDGSLRLSPQLEALANGISPQVWRLAAVNDDLYAAGGSPAQVVRMRAGRDTSQIYQGSEAAVFALAAGQGGSIWFAPAPGGTLYRYDGKLQQIATLQVKYVWDLLPQNDGMLVATGMPGMILHVRASGAIDTVFASNEVHIRALAQDRDGRLYAGSADNGIIYRFDRDRRPFVVFDSPETEIFAIVPAASGAIWAAGTKEGTPRPGGAPGGLDIAEITILDSGGNDESDSPAPAPPTARPVTTEGSIYRILPNGVARDFWQKGLGAVQSLALQDDGSLLVGTGGDGRLYQLRENGSISLLLDVDAKEITRLLQHKGKTYAATANGGGCYRIQSAPAKRGEYTSPVIDAEVQAQWGSLSWTQSGTATFYTRSGNSQTPDQTWSAWGKALKQSGGSAIDAPVARFLQWRVVLEQNGVSAPSVKDVSLGYLQVNVAPEVEDIRFLDFGVAYPEAVARGREVSSLDHRRATASNGNAHGGSNFGKKTLEPGFQSVAWRASDANKDELEYHLYFRRIGSEAWKTLVSSYRSTVYSWDTRTMESGEYQIKIVATDAPNNEKTRALQGEKISDPLIVDNSPPQVSQLAYSNGKVSFAAEDGLSRLVEAYYAINAGQWFMIYPDDGILDSRRESFTIAVDSLPAGEHTITVKIYDEKQNVAFAHLSFKR